MCFSDNKCYAEPEALLIQWPSKFPVKIKSSWMKEKNMTTGDEHHEISVYSYK
ncbi:hypothetical protein Mapa_002134 [Marchantia paleacea]|nr:hypothetical protein Mapa_002134 [Marchantia paleacea]